MSGSPAPVVAKNRATRDLIANHQQEFKRLYRKHADALGVRRFQPAPHGTVAAYRRHRYHGETACRACKAANAKRNERYRRRAA